MTPSYRDLIDQFITGRRTFEFETEEFVRWRHDRDLIPALHARVIRITEAYGYFTALVFETQGINDNGSDVSVRFRELGADEDGLQRVLGFQLKSHIELQSKDAVQVIKAQRDDAFRKIPDLAAYYIVLCCDEKPLKKRLNAIRAEFLKAERTTVVSPTQALRFFRYEPHQIDAQVKRMLDDSDAVLREMRNVLEPYSDTAKALVCSLAARLLASGAVSSRVRDLRGSLLKAAYERIVGETEAHRDRLERARDAGEVDDAPSPALDDESDEVEAEADLTLRLVVTDPDTLLAVDLEALEPEFVCPSQDGEAVEFQIRAAASIIAVASDAMVRFGYGEHDVLPYLLDLAGI